MIFTRQLLLSSLKGDKWCSFDQLIPFMATSEGGELLGSRLSEDLNPLTNQWLAVRILSIPGIISNLEPSGEFLVLQGWQDS
ncbi:hypothetical protein AGIG_G18323 [Arapaima gigas]